MKIAETVPFRKISTPGNQVKLRYFSQWNYLQKLSMKKGNEKDFQTGDKWRICSKLHVIEEF